MIDVVNTAFITDDTRGKHRANSRKLEFCNQFLILYNQDLPNTLRNMIRYVEDNKLAGNIRAVPSACGRLNYVADSAKQDLEKLKTGDLFVIVFFHKNSYESYLLKVTNDHNYEVVDCEYYENFKSCCSKFNEFKKNSRKTIIVPLITNRNEEKSRRLGKSITVKYKGFEEMIYRGGVAKLKANFNGSNEVLDISPNVVVDFVDEHGNRKSATILGCNARQIAAHTDNDVLSYKLSFSRWISFMTRKAVGPYKVTLIPRQESGYVVFNLDIDDYGILKTHICSYDTGFLESFDEEETIPTYTKEGSDVGMVCNVIRKYNVRYVAPTKTKDERVFVLSMKKEGDAEFFSGVIVSKSEVPKAEKNGAWIPMKLTVNSHDSTTNQNLIEYMHLDPLGTNFRKFLYFKYKSLYIIF